MGWDPVLTTCILCEKVITPRPTIEMNAGTRIPSSGRSREELRSNLLEASHLTPPLTKFSHNNLKRTFFNKNTILIKNKQNSLLQLSTRYFSHIYNSSHNIFIISSSSHENTCSVYRIPPQNTPRKTETIKLDNKSDVTKKNRTGHSLCSSDL